MFISLVCSIKLHKSDASPPPQIPGYGGCGEDGRLEDILRHDFYLTNTESFSSARMMSSVKIDSEVWYFAVKTRFLCGIKS